jgi:transcriptional regulator with XRE-family HTH domain
LRAVRMSRGLRQSDVATRAGTSRSTVSRLECGRPEGVTIGTIRSISRAVGMPPLATMGWRGPEVDRLLDEAHSAMVEGLLEALTIRGWATVPEYSFSHFGERGSVDVLAWNEAARALLIVEVKTRVWDLQAMLASLDRKRRLVPELAAGTVGWRPLFIGVVLVLNDGSSSRAVVAKRAATFRAVLPDRQLVVRNWLDRPEGHLRGIWFLHNDRVESARLRMRPKRSRVRARRAGDRQETATTGQTASDSDE